MTGCGRKNEVRELMSHGHWPEAAGKDLRAHVAGCAECREWVAVTKLLRGAREASVRGKQLPPAGLIWWRAQVRRRQEAMAAVDRPLRWAQTAALVLGVCAVVCALVVSSSVWMTPEMRAVAAAHQETLVRAAAAMLVCVGIAVGWRAVRSAASRGRG